MFLNRVKVEDAVYQNSQVPVTDSLDSHTFLHIMNTSGVKNRPVFKNFVFEKVENIRSNHQRCSVRKGVLRNFAKLTGKHLCQSLFFNKIAGLWRLLLKHKIASLL